jgi:hypothetical protein
MLFAASHARGSERTNPPVAEVLPLEASLTGWDHDWSKIPPVRPAPRAGLFVIPSSGPGYYSLEDLLHDRMREKPPVQPWGFLAGYAPGFFDTDFRYLDKPDNQQFDCLDPLKRIHCGDDWLLSLGGQTWLRYMDENDSRFTARDNDYTLFRTRLYADLWYQDCLRLFAEFLYAERLDPELDPLPIDINRSDLQNGFIELKVATLEDKPVYVRVGRQELNIGSQRLISTIDWANTRRTFQGVRGYRAGEKLDVDLFWVQPIVVNRNDFDSVDNDQNFFGAWATYRPRRGTTWDLYYLNLDQARHVADGFGGQLGAFNIHTVGSRFAGDWENWLWDVEAMLQAGTWSNQDFLAGACTVSGGYHFKNCPWNPQFWLAYDWASGESRPGADDTRNTFNQLFAFGHYYFGYLDLVGRQNIRDLNGQFAFQPMPWITAITQVHRFWLAEERDALYNAAGRPTRRDPTGAAGRDVGWEVDLYLSLHVSTHCDVLVGWSKLFAGEFISRTGPDVSPELFYVQVGHRW